MNAEPAWRRSTEAAVTSSHIRARVIAVSASSWLTSPRTSERRDEKDGKPAVKHLPANQAHGMRNRRDAASAERRRVDDAQQLVAERDVALERGVQSAVGGVGILQEVEQLDDGHVARRDVALGQRFRSTE